MATVSEIIERASALPQNEQWHIVDSLMSTLKGPAGAKKGRKLKDPSATKRAVKPDSYIHLLHKIVTPFLKQLAELTPDEDDKKFMKQVLARSQIAKALYEQVKAITDEDKESESEQRAYQIKSFNLEDIEDAYKAWKMNPPVVLYKGKKAAKAAANGDVTPVPAPVAAPVPAPVAAPAPKVVEVPLKIVSPPEVSSEDEAAKKKKREEKKKREGEEKKREEKKEKSEKKEKKEKGEKKEKA